MKAKKLAEHGNELAFEISDINAAIANSLRRLMMNEVPVMAIEDVEFKKNNSIMYDEQLAHRLGLVPLTTDLKSYDLVAEDASYEAAKHHVKLTLSGKGPATIYARDIKSSDPKVKPIYPDMPIVKLLKNQEFELVATARLGLGRWHSKWQSGLVNYRQRPSIKVSGKLDPKLLKHFPAITEKNGKYSVDEELLALTPSPEMYEDLGVTVEYSKDTFIFTIESWGQLQPRQIIEAAFDTMDGYCKEFEKLVKGI